MLQIWWTYQLQIVLVAEQNLQLQVVVQMPLHNHYKH
jgi:hypothetical protein